MTSKNDFGLKRPCPCTQEAADTIKYVEPTKEGMPKEVRCKGCGKISLTSFETEYCYDCRKDMKR